MLVDQASLLRKSNVFFFFLLPFLGHAVSRGKETEPRGGQLDFLERRKEENLYGVVHE